MKRTTTRTGLAIALCLFVNAPAFAQPSIAQASEQAQAAARSAYAEGVQAFERRAYAQALERFDAADAAVSSPNVKLMRARCLAKLGKDAEAYAMFAATVAEAKASGEARYQASAEAAASEASALEAKVVLLTVSVKDESGQAVLAINGETLPRERWSEAVPLPPGAVTVVLSGPEGQEERIERTLAAGTRASLALSVAAKREVPAAEPAPAVQLSPQPARAADKDGVSVLPIALGAAGAAGIVAFAVFGAMSSGELATLERECPSQRDCDPELAEVASRGRTYQTIANVSLGVGIVLLAAGVTLFVIDLPSDDLEVALTSNGAQLRGSL